MIEAGRRWGELACFSGNPVTPPRHDWRMDLVAVIERVERIAAVRRDTDLVPDQVRDALRATTQVRAWLAANEAALTAALAEQVSFPERDVAECTRGSTRDAIRTKERSDTLESAPSLADALESAAITAGHVDEVTKAVKSLDDDDQRSELFDRLDDLLDVAAAATVAEFRRRLEMEAKRIRRDDGVERLERQRRATRLRTWTDGDGMICLSGRFDPITGRSLVARLDHATQALFAEAVPDTCPTDPVDKQRHLQALALTRLINGDAPARRPGRPEYVVVIDSSQSDGADGPLVDWGLPIEVPYRVLTELSDGADVHPVVVRNGVIVHAPGQLDLGRTTRLANRAQRRALRAMYSTCAIPGCDTRFDHCHIHHVIWWRHGGRTDLDNLIPICNGHHTKVHDQGWHLTLGPDRRLTLELPDGTIHNTSPPNRRVA